MQDTIRTFIAITLPGTLLDRFREIRKDLAPKKLPVRWVRPEGIHLTLKFLGDIKPGMAADITRAMNESTAGLGPMSLSARGIGVFPTIKRPRVLWIGTGGDLEPLRNLQARLEENLEKIGFAREKRPFRSHLTLGRFKDRINPEKIADVMKEYANFFTEPFIADKIVLYKSDLKPSGAVYTKLETVSLAGSREPGA